MPEGPEVALTAEILNKKLKNKTLVSFDFVAGRYGPDGTPPEGFNKFEKNLPMKLIKVNSKGKFMWMEFEGEKSNWYVWNTFGLKGMWSFFEPKNCRAMLTFSKENLVAYYSDSIGYGTFYFSKDKAELDKKLKTLGPDFLKESDIDFSALSKYHKPIAEILSDQKKIGSGIGQYLIAEILYRAKISPTHISSTLTEDEIKNLKYWIAYMMKLSYESNDIGYMINLTDESAKLQKKNYHPEIKLKKSDKKFAYMVYQKKTDPLGNKVKTVKMSKGLVHWVPKIQK